MKRLLFVGIVSMFCISCTVNKNALRKAYNTPPSDEEKYFGTANSISHEAALAMIGTFVKHKYRGWKKHKIDSTSNSVDLNQMRTILDDPNVDSAKIFLAVEINPDDDSTFRLPTVVIQVKLKGAVSAISKGGSDELSQAAQYQYLRSVIICPPPKGDCRVQVPAS